MAALNTVAIEVEAAPGARIIAFSAGLDDALYEHDGQITKREIRAITLSSLAPLRGQLLWDIGAGSGSIAIEWMLAHPSMRAMRIEASEDRAARIRRNAAAFGVPASKSSKAMRPQALRGLATPDASSSAEARATPGVLDAAIAALRLEAGLSSMPSRSRPRPNSSRATRAWAARSRASPFHARKPLAARRDGARDARDAMGMGEAVIVAGIGCRKGASPAEIEAVIARRARTRGLCPGQARCHRHPADKGGKQASLPLLCSTACRSCSSRRLISKPRLARCETHSQRVPRGQGVPSVAEAAALAAGGPDAKLLLPRDRGRTCNLRARRDGSAP
jgi:precorrin-6Y C5,15-methyltransferase (decarboxylating) CbiT subunit